MAFEHFDNAGQYGEAQEARLLNGIYAQASNVTLVEDPDPTATGSTVFKLRSGGLSSPAILRYVLAGAKTSVGLASRLWLTDIPDGPLRIPTPFTWADENNVTLLSVQISPTGSFIIRSTDDESGTILAETDGPVITANAWWHFEAWATFNGGGGCDLEIRREGNVILSENLPTITAANADQVRFVSRRTSNFVTDIDLYLKDLLIMNSDTAYNNDFAGALVVYMLQMASDVDLNWSLVGGSSGFSILDNIPANDASYLVAGTPAPGAYRATMTNLPDDVTTVRALMTVVRAQKVDGGDGNLQVGLISNGTTGNGENRAITAGMSYWRDIFPTDPDTDAAWLPGAVDATDFTMNRTA